MNYIIELFSLKKHQKLKNPMSDKKRSIDSSDKEEIPEPTAHQPEDTSSTSDENKAETPVQERKKLKSDSTNEPVEKTPYFALIYMNTAIAKECLITTSITATTWKIFTGKGQYLPLEFDNSKLQEIIRKEEFPYHMKKLYSPPKVKTFYFQTPVLYFPYGYSPSVPPGSDNVANKLVADLTCCSNDEEMKLFLNGLDAIDKNIFDHAKSLYTKLQKDNDSTISDEAIERMFNEKWKPAFKREKNTLTFALNTQKKNDKLDIDADPYCATLRVWEDEGSKTPLTTQLRKENSVLYDVEEEEKKRKKMKNKPEEDVVPKKIIIGERCWMRIGGVFERIFLNGVALNYKITALDAILFASPEENNGNPF